MELKIDQEFKELIPALSVDEVLNLEQSILTEGCRDALVTWQGYLIDGHNRYAICTKHNLPFNTVEKQFESRDDVSIWMIRNQFGRRNLIPFIRAELALKLEGLFQKKALENKQVAAEEMNNQKRQNIEETICQNSDKTIEQNIVKFDKEETEEIEFFDKEEIPLVQPKQTNFDRAEQALKVENSFQEKAKTAMINKLEQNPIKPEVKPFVKPPMIIKKVDTKRELAKIAGVSHDTIERVKKIQEKAPEELMNKVKTGEMSINQAYTVIKREEKEQKREEKTQENVEKVSNAKSVEELKGVFQTIVIDPPWDWGDEKDVNQMGRAKPDYATIPFEDLLKYPVGKFADENCHLYLWVTNRSLPKAFDLLKSWGFRYITCLTWVKPNFGLGNYFRGSTEQVLFAIKGSMPLKRKDVGTHFNAPRGEKHSEKPMQFYELVESCSYGPYLELFSRHERDGWTMWGE